MQPVPKLNLNNSPTSGTSKTSYRLNGNTYVIKTTESNEDVEDIFSVIDNMYDNTVLKSNNANYKAFFYKLCHVFSSIFIVIVGSIIGALGASNSNNSNIICINNTITDTQQPFIYAITIMGFAITAIKSLATLFNIEQRSIMMKQISIRLRRISREIKMLKTIHMTPEEYCKKMEEYNILIDELEINMFGEITNTLDNKNIIHKEPENNANDIKITI
jgi:hypothetical protein